VSVPRAINKFFIALLKIEAKLHIKNSLPAGTSVITILRKVIIKSASSNYRAHAGRPTA
jgi:hypothetical protein